MSIRTTYSTNFIKITDTVPQIQQFKLQSSLFQVDMQLHIEYARIANQIITAFHQQFKCFNHECQTPIAYSVFKQTVLNVSAQQLQQHTIKICCKMIQIVLSVNSRSKSFCIAENGLLSQHYVGQLWHVSSLVLRHSTSHMIIHWHIHMVHFLLLLHQNCSLVTGSRRKLYF